MIGMNFSFQAALIAQRQPETQFSGAKTFMLLFIALPFVFQPTIGMAAAWVFVRPMNHAALLAPFVFAVKRDAVAFFQGAVLDKP